jgi:hypothetical protein
MFGGAAPAESPGTRYGGQRRVTARPPSTDPVEPVGSREETRLCFPTWGGLADTCPVGPGVWIDPCEQKLLYASPLNGVV